MHTLNLLQAMRLYVLICHGKSFSEAAQEMEMSASAASKTIQQLENHLHTRLLSRTTRSIKLTSDGEIYFQHCQDLLRQLAETETLFVGKAESVRGKIRVDLPGRIASRLIVPALPYFFEQYPGLQLELSISDKFVDPILHGMDCVIRVGGELDERMVARRLGQLQMGTFASPEYLRKYGMPAHPSELTQHFAVGYAHVGTPSEASWEYEVAGQTQAVELRQLIRVSDIETYIACGVRGLGLIQVPYYDAQDYLQRGDLMAVLPDFTVPGLPVAVLYPRLGHAPSRLHIFLDWVQQLLQQCMQLRPVSAT